MTPHIVFPQFIEIRPKPSFSLSDTCASLLSISTRPPTYLFIFISDFKELASGEATGGEEFVAPRRRWSGI